MLGKFLKYFKKKGQPTISVIIPAYNSEKYIYETIKHIYHQEDLLANLEIIVVDDGSTDSTVSEVLKWENKFKNKLKLLRTQNRGVCSARNAGISAATGKWVAFVDSDDFLHPSYFSMALKAIQASPEYLDIAAVFTNLIMYNEASGEYDENHPLSYKFKNGIQFKPCHDLGDFIQISACSAIFDLKAIRDSGVLFNEKIRSAFEDAAFVIEFLTSSVNSGRHCAFQPESKYFCRKRLAKNSITDTQVENRSRYIEQFRDGYLFIVASQLLKHGEVKNFVQRTIHYQIMWIISGVIHYRKFNKVLSEFETNEFIRLCREVYKSIDEGVIEGFSNAALPKQLNFGVIGYFKGVEFTEKLVNLEDCDQPEGLLKFSYYSSCGPSNNLRILVNGKVVSGIHRSKNSVKFLNQDFYTNNFFWLKLDNDDIVEFEISGCPVPIWGDNRIIGPRLSVKDAYRELYYKKGFNKNIPIPDVLARNDNLKALYDGCDVYIDRIDKAGDNAEHLYRYIKNKDLTEKSFFILSEKSRDYARLKKEGFKLVSFESDDYLLAVAYCKNFISSQAETTVRYPLGREYSPKLFHNNFIFLPHGITTHNMSAWLNSIDARYVFIPTTYEKKSFCDVQGDYVFSDREVVMTGLPRHDYFLSFEGAARETILISPTWRYWLTAKDGQSRESKQSQSNSNDYFDRWRAILNCQELREIADAENLKLVFLLHPNMVEFVNEFKAPNYVRVLDPLRGINYQEVLASAKVVLTCYSSLAAEAAYLEIPSIYYEFDSARVYSGEHTYGNILKNSKRIRYGKVCTEHSDVISSLKDIIINGQAEEFLNVSRENFQLKDGNSCKRIHEHINKLSTRKIEIR